MAERKAEKKNGGGHGLSLSSFLPAGKERNKTQEEKLSLAHEFIARYYAIKIHAWRGKLDRIFCIGHNTVATIHPSALFKLTNEWKYGTQFFDAMPKPGSDTEWTITVKKGGSSEAMTFSSPDRCEVLTELQKQRSKFAPNDANIGKQFACRKLRWTEEWKDITLVAAAHGLQQQGPQGNVLGCYEYWLIRAIGTVEGMPNAFYIKYTDNHRIHIYQSDRRDELIKKALDTAQKYVGQRAIKTGPEEKMDLSQFERVRLGKIPIDQLVSTSEFGVMKATSRYEQPIRRKLCITDSCLVERDPGTYNAVTSRPLLDIFALVRREDDSQKFAIEWKDNTVKVFLSTDRDALLASLLDAVRRAGNIHCCLKMNKTDRGHRTGPIRHPVCEVVESTLLKVMGEYDNKLEREIISFPLLIRYFNNNVEFSGLLHTESKEQLFAENKERLIATAITSLLVHASESPSPEQAADQFYALRRLAASRTGFEAFTKIPGFVKRVGKSVVTALRMNHDAVSHAAIDFLATLLYPMHDKYDIHQELANRRALLASHSFLSKLVGLLQQHAQALTGSIVVSALLDFFVFALCPPYSDTTDPNHFTALLEMVAEVAGPSMFRLYLHPCMALGIGTGMLMKTIIQECESQAKRLQRYALAEGTVLRHFHLAIWGKHPDQRELARQLLALWAADCVETQELLKRMVPPALLAFLASKDRPPGDTKKPDTGIGIAANHWRLKMGVPTPAPQSPDQPPVQLRKARNLVQVSLNWDYFFHQLMQDHLRPDVIWMHHTREELRESIERELALLSQGMDTRRGQEIAWNHVEFEVLYECLRDEIRIGQHFLRLLLEDPNPQIHNPKEFFFDLYHRFLLVSDSQLKSQCLHGMSRLYETYAADIGIFNDLVFIVQMLRDTTDKLERDRLMQFLANLLRVRGNAKLFVDCQGIPILVDLLTLAHLHHDRAQLRTQSNVIEMNPDQQLGSEPEWYWQDASGEQQGPVSLDTVRTMYEEGKIGKETRMWAQGLDAWHDLAQVPQLRWTLVYPSAGVLDPTQLACLVLDVLIRMCHFWPTRNEDGVVIRPVPRVKRMLAEPTVLPHIVQILLTLDPGLVNRTAVLLSLLMDDNPVVPRLYLTGVFYFALMYMGSDVKPICRLLHLTHDKQAFHSDHGRSILAPMLPKAMVCFLQNHGIDKFAEVFLGEFDNPEAIWSNTMRQLLVQKIAMHLMEFTPKLRSNTRAIYTFCPITPVEYPQLQNELFCNIYYLRHLCDTTRFPDWPISNPVELLRDTLQEWAKELDKKGNKKGLTRESALETLELPVEETDAGKIRKAYFVLASKYHPDKNPEGREHFELILKAYEYLTNPNLPTDTPDPKRLVLLMKTQSILFVRYKALLSEYKYAGYQALLRHVEQETHDPMLFSKEDPLLPAATELLFHTVNTSPLNAEELLREGGLGLLKEALERCMDVIGEKSKDGELPVVIASRIIETFAVAANFESCREALQEMPQIVDMVCKSITCEEASRLTKAAIFCCSAFAAGSLLQNQLYESGVLWLLLRFVFKYDYTLDEGGVERNAESNQQEFANIQAKAAIFTICRLCGYMTGENATSPHVGMHQALMMVLTPYVVHKLRMECKGELDSSEPTVLKLLNSNSETPYMLWNNGTRAELLEFLESMKANVLKRDDPDMPPGKIRGLKYSAHEKELMVGGVYVRLYNEQPHYPLLHPENFVGQLLSHIAKEVPNVKPGEDSPSMAQIGACVQALAHALVANPAAASACNDSYKLLFDLLNIVTEPICCSVAEVIQQCLQNHSTVVEIAQASLLTPLLLCMAKYRSCVSPLNQILITLAGVTKAVGEMLDKGVYILLLYEFATTRVPDVRESACTALGKLAVDKLHGPKIALRAGKVVPQVFIDTMKENTSAVSVMFDSTSENPELIWTPEMREAAIQTCTTLRQQVIDELAANPNLVWRLPENIGASKPANELEVGGVYLKLYVKQPSWSLRSPRTFLTALFEEFLTRVSSTTIDGEVVDLVSLSIVCLLNAQPSLADQVPQLGHVPKLFANLGQLVPVVAPSALRILHQLSLSKQVVETMGQVDCINPMLTFMRSEEMAEHLGQCIETLERMLTRNNYENGCLVRRCLDSDMPNFLLGLLTSKQSNTVRAVAVKCLKAMCNGASPNCQLVKDILAGNSTWNHYQAQNHDLFLTKETFAGYLTGPGGGGAVLSLTAGPMKASSAAHSSAPPPIKDQAEAVLPRVPVTSTVPPPVRGSSTPPVDTKQPTAAPKTPEPEPEPAKAPEPEPAKAPEPEPAKAPEPEPAKAPEPEPAKAPEPEPAKAPEPEQPKADTPQEATE